MNYTRIEPNNNQSFALLAYGPSKFQEKFTELVTYCNEEYKGKIEVEYNRESNCVWIYLGPFERYSKDEVFQKLVDNKFLVKQENEYYLEGCKVEYVTMNSD